MKKTLILAAMLFTFKLGVTQNAVNLSGMRFKNYQSSNEFGSSEILDFKSNSKATIILHSNLFHTVCPCSYTITGNKLKITGICHEDEPNPYKIEYSFTYDKNKRILVDSRYLYSNGSAPTSDLVGKPIIWRQE